MRAENVTTSDQIVKLNKDISDIKNVLSTYSDYFKSHFSEGPGGTKNDEFKTPPSPFQPEVSSLQKLSEEDIIHHIKSSDSWIYLKAMLEMDYIHMDLLNLFCWVHGVCKYASTLFGVINTYKSMQTDVEEYDDFYEDSFE